MAFCPPARMGIATERLFTWTQARYIGSMSHAQPRRGEHGDHVDTSQVGTERSCRGDGQGPLALWLSAERSVVPYAPTFRIVVYR